jgi:putative PIN family toxin of toxin-antitoxin system
LRAVLDVNVLISALLSRTGAPSRLLSAWREGHFDLIVSPALLAELSRALEYPKLRRLVPERDAEAFVVWLSRSAVLARDPDGPPPVRSADAGDDYLLALAADSHAVLVSGDGHLLALAGEFPIQAPADFLARLPDAADASQGVD